MGWPVLYVSFSVFVTILNNSSEGASHLAGEDTEAQGKKEHVQGRWVCCTGDSWVPRPGWSVTWACGHRVWPLGASVAVDSLQREGGPAFSAPIPTWALSWPLSSSTPPPPFPGSCLGGPRAFCGSENGAPGLRLQLHGQTQPLPTSALPESRRFSRLPNATVSSRLIPGRSVLHCSWDLSCCDPRPHPLQPLAEVHQPPHTHFPQQLHSSPHSTNSMTSPHHTPPSPPPATPHQVPNISPLLLHAFCHGWAWPPQDSAVHLKGP